MTDLKHSEDLEKKVRLEQEDATENKSKVEQEQHFETEQAAQALEMVHTLLNWREAHARSSVSDPNELMTVNSHADTEMRWVLDGLHPADIAYVLEALPLDDRLHVWGLVDPERDGDILMEVSDSVRETLIADMSRQEMVAAAKSLDTDEIADLADDLPREVVEEVAESLPLEERAQLRAAMSYPDDSVGAAMDYDMLTTGPDRTLEMVLSELRKMDALPEQTDQIFVVDEDSNFLGRLSLNRLLVNQPDVLVSDVMRKEVFQLNPLDEMDDAAQAF